MNLHLYHTQRNICVSLLLALSANLLILIQPSEASVEIASLELSNEITPSTSDILTKVQSQPVINSNDLVDLQPELQAGPSGARPGISGGSGEQFRRPAAGPNVASIAFINGNQATYVEPPEDFKPIIYERERQEAALVAAGSSLASSGWTQGEPPEPARPLKEPVGRWSEWHDMSIEPDLASSDTLQAPSFYSVQRSSVPPAPMRVRKRARQAQQQRATSGLGQPKGQSESGAQAESRSRSPAGRINQVSVAAKRPPLQQAIKGAHSAQQVGVDCGQKQLKSGSTFTNLHQASYFDDDQAATLNLQKVISPTKLINIKLLNDADLDSSSTSTSDDERVGKRDQLYASKNSQIEAKRMKPVNKANLEAASQQEQIYSSQSKQDLKANEPQLEQSGQSKRHLKRRKKSKTNAEVRIQQLVAASQQHYQEMLKRDGQAQKQVNGLNVVRLGALDEPKAKRMHFGGAQLKANYFKDDIYDDDDDDNDNDDRATLSRASHQSGQVFRRLANLDRPPQMLNQNHNLNQMHNQNPNFNSNATQLSSRKVLRRRRIKSQLPVGLSSWFLGGMRDLDGRHWHLPAEIISRLAINDVDLVHPVGFQPVKIIPPSAGNVVLINAPATNTNINPDSINVASSSSRQPPLKSMGGERELVTISTLPSIIHQNINQMNPR